MALRWSPSIEVPTVQVLRYNRIGLMASRHCASPCSVTESVFFFGFMADSTLLLCRVSLQLLRVFLTRRHISVIRGSEIRTATGSPLREAVAGLLKISLVNGLNCQCPKRRVLRCSILISQRDRLT